MPFVRCQQKFTRQLFHVLKRLFVGYVCLNLLAACAGAAEPPITALAFTPDAGAVVVGSQAGLVVRSWPDLQQQRKIATQLVNVLDLAFSPNGKFLAVAGGHPAEEGLVELFDWPGGESIQIYSGHRDSVAAIVWTSNSTFATASLDREIILWETTSKKPVRRLRGHSRGVTALCYLANEQLLISAGIDRNLRVWEAASGKLVRSLNNHTKEVHQLATRPRTSAPHTSGLAMAASVGDDRTVRLWQPSIGRMVRFAQLDAAPLAVAWLPDGSRIAVTTTAGDLQLIDPDTVEIVQKISAVEGWAYSLAAHPTDGSLLVGGQNGQLRRIIPGGASP